MAGSTRQTQGGKGGGSKKKGRNFRTPGGGIAAVTRYVSSGGPKRHEMRKGRPDGHGRGPGTCGNCGTPTGPFTRKAGVGPLCIPTSGALPDPDKPDPRIVACNHRRAEAAA